MAHYRNLAGKRHLTKHKLTPVALSLVQAYFSRVSLSNRYVGANVISSSSTIKFKKKSRCIFYYDVCQFKCRECTEKSCFNPSNSQRVYNPTCCTIGLHWSACWVLTKMQEDFSIIPFHGELVFTEEFLVLLLFDLCHNVLSFLWRETVESSDFSCLKVLAAESSDTWQPACSFMH